jgi:hypothetical protein
LTEPLYIALTMGGLLTLAGYLHNGRQVFLVSAAILIAASSLTRYAGLATIAAGAVALLVVESSHEKAGARRVSFFSSSLRFRMAGRIADSLIFIAVCGLPIALFAFRNYLKSGVATDRKLVFHPVKVRQIVAAFSTVAQWLLVGKVRADVRFIEFVIEVLMLACLVIFATRKQRHGRKNGKDSESKLPHVLAIFILAYVTQLLATINFFEADTVLDSRSLLPVHFAALMLGLWLARQFHDRIPTNQAIRIAMPLLALLLAASYAFRGARWITVVASDGQGYASRKWRESPTIAELRKLAPTIPVYTNGADAVYYLSGRPALEIPAPVDRGTAQPNRQYERDVERMKTDIQTHNGVLLYFQGLPERTFLPSEDQLRSRLPFDVVSLSDGSIFRAHANASR